jgi:hypothetical protein
VGVIISEVIKALPSQTGDAHQTKNMELRAAEVSGSMKNSYRSFLPL